MKSKIRLGLSCLWYYNNHRYPKDILTKKNKKTGHWETGKAQMGKQNVIS